MAKLRHIAIAAKDPDAMAARRFGRQNRDCPDAQRHPIRMLPGDRPPVLDVLRSPSNVGLPRSL